MLENLAVPQLEAENFIKMECHIIIISVVMGRRLIHLALEIPIFDIPPFFVWIYETLGMGGLGEQTPCVTSQVWITASIETIMVEMVSSVCVCAEISYCLYMPCDEMSAHENLLNQMFWICTTPTIAADPLHQNIIHGSNKSGHWCNKQTLQYRIQFNNYKDSDLLKTDSDMDNMVSRAVRGAFTIDWWQRTGIMAQGVLISVLSCIMGAKHKGKW